MPIQTQATEQCFPVVQFIMLYKVILTFESVVEILKCAHSDENYWPVLPCDTLHFLPKGNVRKFCNCSDTITICKCPPIASWTHQLPSLSTLVTARNLVRFDSKQ